MKSFYLLYGADEDGFIKIGIYDIEKRKELISKQFNSIGIFSYFVPRDIITTDGKYIYFTKSDQYKIEIYDLNFKQIDSIVYKKQDWKLLTEQRMQEMYSISPEPADIIYNFGDEVEKYSSLRRLFAFDSNLIVMYSCIKDDKYSFLYDLWQKDNDGKWSLKYEDVNDYKKGFVCTNKLKAFREFVFKDKFIYACDTRVPIFRKDYKTEEEYIKAYEDYQIEKDCLLTIEKLHLK